MDKKAIAEIRRLIRPDSCVDRIRGCYVSEDGSVIRELHDSVHSMEKESLEKYCEILRSALSGKPGRNLFNMEFPLEEEGEGGRQQRLYSLLQTELKDDGPDDSQKNDSQKNYSQKDDSPESGSRVTEFFEKVVENFRIEGKYLILLMHGSYDIPARGSDNTALEDASDYVYSFLVCAICPVNLMKEGLCYDEEACTFLDRRTDWAVQKPVCGFLYPAFNDRQPDIHSLLYYCRREQERHEEISADLLGCSLPIPETDQKDLFKSMVEQTLGRNCDFENVKNLSEAVGDIIEQQKDSGEPAQIEKADMRRILMENGADQDVLSDFDAAYDEAVGAGAVLMAENLVDTGKLEVTSPNVKIRVSSEMSDMLTTKVIDGMEYLLIPVVDDLEVNGIRILQARRDKQGEQAK